MAHKPREKKENWLLIKGDDDFARGDKDPDILEERPESVKTGRVVEEIEGEAPGWSSKTGRIEQPKQRRKQLPKSKLPKKAKKAGHPGFIAPALATLKAAPPSGRKWLHERSEEHTSELQSLMRISYAVFCLKKKTKHKRKRQMHK